MPTCSIVRNASLSAILLVLFVIPVYGQSDSRNEFTSAASQISKQTGNSYRLVRLGINKTPAILTPNKSDQAKAIPTPERENIASVRNFAKSEALFVAGNALGLPESVELLECGTSRTGNLWLSSYTISYSGIPLRERYLRMNIGAISGKVMLVRNNIPSKQPNSLAPAASSEEITSQITTLLGVRSEIKSTPQLVYVDELGNPELLLCYEVKVKDPDMNELWRLTFDAATGGLVEKKSLLEHGCFSGDEMINDTPLPYSAIAKPFERENPLAGVSGKISARVHLHAPFDTLTTVGLPLVKLKVNGVQLFTDSNGFWSLPSATPPVNISTSFDGKFFSIIRQDSKANSELTTSSTNILWDDSNSDATERDAYYSASFGRFADKNVDPKLTNLDSHMNINVNVNSTCNAYYSPDDTSLNFFSAGGGCSNTGQIADVVFHEYGHRVTNARYQQQSGQNININDGSLGEGFADLNSAFIRDDPRIGIQFYGNNTRILRNCNNTKKWPHDDNGDIHVSGEIISGAFWDLRKAIGNDTAEHLFHLMEYQMPDGTGQTDSASLGDAFTSTLSAAVLTDDDDNDLSNGTPHLTQILASFALHNITLRNFINLNVSKVEDQDTTATSYRVKVTASYSGLVGSIDNESVSVLYSIDNGLTFHPVSLSPSGNNTFTGAIPKVPAGTIVKYYASAVSTLAEKDTVMNPVRAQAYSFLVGYHQVFVDDGEKDRGWSLSSAADAATTGLWVRDTPHGTYNDPTPPIQYVQQDTDHTPFSGTMCYITGNRVDAQGINDPNFTGYDDVDNGTTTLTTPAIDLSALKSPVIRYWYYYSNNTGNNPGIPKWQTDISNDSGATWKSLQLTNQATDGWAEFAFRVADHLSLSKLVRIRFIASDNIQALVEAGVDDLEILDPIFIEPSLVRSIPDLSIAPYPNPIHRGEKLHLRVNENSEVKLTDLLGRTLFNTGINDGSFIIPSNIMPGIYFIEQAGQKNKIVVEP